MSNKGRGVFQVNSDWSSGSLVFFEKSVGRTTTGDLLTIGTTAVKIGGTGQDVDFQFYGTGSISAIIDCGESSFTLTGINISTNAQLAITDTTDASSLTTGSFTTAGGVSIAKQLYLGDDIDMSVSGTGVYDITLKDSVADALSIVRGTTDMMVFDSSTPKITITPATTVSGVLTANNATESTSTTTGGMVVTGGIGFGGDMYAGDDIFLSSGAIINWAAGDVTLTHASNSLTIDGGNVTLATGFDVVVTKGTQLIGNFAATYATGSAQVFSASDTKILGVYGESTSDLTSAYNCRTIVGRHLIVTASATVNHETYGIIGQVCVKNTSLGHYHGGVMGTYESNTAATILTSYGVGGVVGRIGAESTTVNSGGLLAAFLAVANTASWTNNGKIAAFATKLAAGKTIFPIGIYMASGDVTKAAEITSVSDGIYCTSTALTATTGRVGKFVGTVATPNHSDGYGAFEVDITSSGIVAGTSAAFSSWLNFAAGSTPGGNILCAQNNGIYLPTGITASSAKMVMGMRMHYIADDGANPGSLYCFSTNVFSNQITAVFDVNAAVDFRWVSGALTNGACNIPLFRDASAGVTYYVNCYTS